MYDLKEAFEESNLPFRVDVFVWDSTPECFKRRIETLPSPVFAPLFLERPQGL